MPRFTALELRILAALEITQSAGDVARETGAPLNQVIHLQRLYGSPELQAQRRQEDAQLETWTTLSTTKRHGRLHSDQEKLQTPYGSYWRRLLGPPRPVRRAQMVPDDRTEEAPTYDSILETLTKALTGVTSA